MPVSVGFGIHILCCFDKYIYSKLLKFQLTSKWSKAWLSISSLCTVVLSDISGNIFFICVHIGNINL